MKQTFLKIFLFLILIYIFSGLIPSICQTEIPESVKDPTTKYDELLNKPVQTPASDIKADIVKPIATPATTPNAETESDDLSLLLPKLEGELYKNWSANESPRVFKTTSDDLLTELGLEKVLKQTYKKDNHLVDLYIYKFKDFAGAYSAFTVMHRGVTTKLKVGKNASENDSLVDFWKGSYFVNIQTLTENDKDAKEFVVLASQDISENIVEDKMPPVVAVQIPSLNRVQGSEKYCPGSVCAKKNILTPDIDLDSLHLNESGGLIAAQYQFPESDNERISLLLVRYIEKQTAEQTFTSLKESFEKKKSDNKDMNLDYDIDAGLLKITNKKNDYTYIKQRGNLLGIALGITNKKSGEQILALVPWPIEITKPINQP